MPRCCRSSESLSGDARRRMPRNADEISKACSPGWPSPRWLRQPSWPARCTCLLPSRPRGSRSSGLPISSRARTSPQAVPTPPANRNSLRKSSAAPRCCRSIRPCEKLGELRHAPSEWERAIEIGTFYKSGDAPVRDSITVCDFTGLGVEDLYIAEVACNFFGGTAKGDLAPVSACGNSRGSRNPKGRALDRGEGRSPFNLQRRGCLETRGGYSGLAGRCLQKGVEIK